MQVLACQPDTDLSPAYLTHRKKMRLLLVEDNEQLARGLSDMLSLDGHAVDHAMTLSDASAFMAAVEYDLILLDIMLPDGDGRDLLLSIRQRAADVPVIVLTARSEVSDRVSVLDIGADDYLVKPFDFAELEARCRAVLRRRGGNASNLQRLGDVEFDLLAGNLRTARGRIELRNRELRLFEILSGSPDVIFSKSKLLDRLFSADESVSENAIEVYVGRLRKHLQGTRVEIATVRGIGYRLTLT